MHVANKVGEAYDENEHAYRVTADRSARRIQGGLAYQGKAHSMNRHREYD